jgi:DNA polymerase I
MDILAFDCNYMCYRALHTTGWLRNGVAYGFLKAVKSTVDTVYPNVIVFAWDHGRSFRYQQLPGYKSTRKKAREKDPEKQRQYNLMQEQVRLLKTEILPSLGAANNLYIDGYEADDILALIAKHKLIEGHDRTGDIFLMIVSADQDMWQLCERDHVVCRNPRTGDIVGEADLLARYGITPPEFALVKAIEGCKTDDVPGIRGVGLTTAIKHITGAKKHPGITANWDAVRSNLDLVVLPHRQCRQVPILKNHESIDWSKWNKVVSELGMDSLRNTREPIRRK